MPIFDYKCRDCGAEFEQIVRSGNDTVECPGCGGSAVDRQFSGFAVGRASCGHEESCAQSHVCCSDHCCHRH
ncbi:MAG: zinc ribbon domain-containing protein [Victivallaceae bacterium]|nr:zinc ribbon domain-containing protein [Victivallaceae bacterium]